MIDVVNALPEKWRRVVESVYCNIDSSHSRPREARLIGQALRQLFAERQTWCGGVTLAGPDLPDELTFSVHWNGNGDWVAGEP